jgi:hypothetical protein
MFKSRRMRWEGHVARMGRKKRKNKKNSYRVLVGMSERNR